MRESFKADVFGGVIQPGIDPLKLIWRSTPKRKTANKAVSEQWRTQLYRQGVRPKAIDTIEACWPDYKPMLLDDRDARNLYLSSVANVIDMYDYYFENPDKLPTSLQVITLSRRRKHVDYVAAKVSYWQLRLEHA